MNCCTNKKKFGGGWVGVGWGGGDKVYKKLPTMQEITTCTFSNNFFLGIWLGNELSIEKNIYYGIDLCHLEIKTYNIHSTDIIYLSRILV